MSRGARWFTEDEKNRLREQLRIECEKSWKSIGYKKTKISDLTKKVGISTGAFYNLYATKEELFLHVLKQINEQQMQIIKGIITKDPTLDGAVAAIKYIYRLYEENPLLFDFSSPDFWSLVKKFPAGEYEKLYYANVAFLSDMLRTMNLTPKVSIEKTEAIIATLIYTVTFKGKIPYDNYDVFEFLLQSTAKELFA